MPANLKKMMSTLDPVYEYLTDKNIVHGLKDFILSRRINMLAMIPHRHSLLERWFVEGNTKSMIFETPVPLLVLPDLKHKQHTEHKSYTGEDLLADRLNQGND
jgi:hypothetical protein